MTTTCNVDHTRRDDTRCARGGAQDSGGDRKIIALTDLGMSVAIFQAMCFHVNHIRISSRSALRIVV